MNDLTIVNGLIDSRDFLSAINKLRSEASENSLRANDFTNRIADELDGEHYETFVVQNSNNTQSTVYRLDQDQAMQVGMRESKAVRKKIRELLKSKREQAPVIPQSFAEALQLAADQAKQLELAKPKIAFVDNLVNRDTLMNATQVAQKHGLSAKALNKQLEDWKVYNKAVRRARVFQHWFVTKGYGEMKKTESGHDQAMFTNAGEIWINEQLTDLLNRT